jgi:hypothetical protein
MRNSPVWLASWRGNRLRKQWEAKVMRKAGQGRAARSVRRWESRCRVPTSLAVPVCLPGPNAHGTRGDLGLVFQRPSEATLGNLGREVVWFARPYWVVA